MVLRATDNTVSSMNVRVRVPTKEIFNGKAVSLYGVAKEGAFGLWPKHTDYVTALVPSVLMLTDVSNQAVFFGIDHGLLVKRDEIVDVVVARAAMSHDLDELTRTIETIFKAVDEEERVARTALSRLEVNIVRQLGQLGTSSL